MQKIFVFVLLLGLTQAFCPPLATASNGLPPRLEEMQQRLDDLELEKQRLQLQRMLDQQEQQARQVAADEARKEAAELAMRETEETEQRLRQEAKDRADDAAAEQRRQTIISAIQTRNSIYVGCALFLATGLVVFLRRRTYQEVSMSDDQKYGALVIACSSLLSILVLMVSDGWMPYQDYIGNVMSELRIQLIEVKTANDLSPFGYSYDYLIDLPSKYVLFLLLSVCVYGVLTYIGVVSAFRPWKQRSS